MTINTRDKQIINIANIKADNPEALDFKMFMDKQGALMAKITEINGKHQKILKELISEPDIFLDKTIKLFDDKTISTPELDEFIKKISQITELLKLEKETLQTIAELETKQETANYTFKEKQTELEMLNQRIIERIQALKKYDNILEKIEN